MCHWLSRSTWLSVYGHIKWKASVTAETKPGSLDCLTVTMMKKKTQLTCHDICCLFIDFYMKSRLIILSVTTESIIYLIGNDPDNVHRNMLTKGLKTALT